MDYDPHQYRERHNASWDRIRHENASSVRSEPYLPLNNTNYDYNNFAPIVAQNGNYVPQEEILEYIPLENAVHQNQSIIVGGEQEISKNYKNLSSLPQEVLVGDEEEEDFELEDVAVSEDVDDDDEEEEEEEDEVDRPDVYCMECDLKLEDPTLHNVSVCKIQQNTSKFECSTCRKGFNFERNFKIHKIVEHLKAVDFKQGTKCFICSNGPFKRCSAYIGHVKIHVKSELFQCEHCSQEFQNERQLDRHVRHEHSEDVYELVFCPKCQKVITVEETTAHLLLHSAENSLTKNKGQSKKRKPTVRERKFKCPKCEKMFVRPAELARHEMVHKRAELPTSVLPKWKCAICAKEYRHKAGLAEHNKTAHGTPKEYICRVCGVGFSKKCNHDRHVSQIHTLQREETQKFECADCPSSHNTRGGLTRHKRIFHNKTSMKVLKPIPIYERHVCKTCKREFRDRKMLSTHRRMHILEEHRWRDLQEGGERKCDYCEKSFVLRSSLLWHMQKHFEEEEQPVQPQETFCSICDLHFYTNLEYRQHLDEQHTIVCGVCQQKFTSRQSYEDHICNRRFTTKNVGTGQVLPNNKILICRLCRPPQRLTTLRQFKEHRARHLPRKTHLCWTCHKSFRTAQLLSLHAEVHDRQPVQCAHCPQVFHSRVALKQHVRLCHGGDTGYQCVVHVDRNMAMSAKSFAEYGLAGDHSDEHAHRAQSVTEWMEQPQEEEPLAVQQEEEQYSQMGQQGASNAQRAIEQQPIRCEICHHLYNNIELLCDHWQGSDTDTDHSYGFVTCPFCELRIRGAADAANHLRNSHLFARPILSFMKPSDPTPSTALNNSILAPLSGVPSTSTSKKTHQCLHCSKVFSRKNDLNRHLTLHTGEKNHECPTCHTSFRLKSTLISHMLTHSDQPPQLQCTVCQKSFYEKKTLVVHMRLHTGEQPFKCRYCDLHFRTTAMTRTHEKKCAYGGPQRPILPDPSLAATASAFQPQFSVPQAAMARTVTQISSLPDQPLQLSRHSAFASVNTMSGLTAEMPIYVITKPITSMQYVVIVQKMKPPENSMRYAVDTASEIRVSQLQESTNLSIVLHNEMRLNLNTVKLLQILPSLGQDEAFKTRINVGESEDFEDGPVDGLFQIIAHNTTTGGTSSFLRRCDICEVDLSTKEISDAHFYSVDHETAQLMYPSTSQQQSITAGRNLRGGPNSLQALNIDASEFACKLCGSRFLDMNSLLNHIRREHDEPVVPPRPVAHTAPIN